MSEHLSEAVARALWEACRGEGSGLAWEDKRVSDLYRNRYRGYAAAAIAAMTAAPSGPEPRTDAAVGR